MFNIQLYTFKKHENSTERPTSTGVVFPCRILSNSSIIAPVVEISRDNDCTNYNYAYIPEFNRYYWINNISFNNTMWVLALSCDVLATYKNEIGESNLYILRASNASDGRITDNYYQPIADYTTDIQMQDTSTTFSTDFRSGKFIVSAMGLGGTGASGSELVYQVNYTNFQLIMQGLYTQLDGVGIDDAFNWLNQKFGGNPKELLSGIMWMPALINFPHNNSTWVYFGNYQTWGSGEPITANTVVLPVIEFNLPKHPKASTKGVYLNTAPFTQYQLYISGVGLITLDSSKTIEDTKIEIYRTVDVKGKCLNVIIGNNSRYKYATVYSQIGVPINLNGSDAGSSIIGGLTTTALSLGTAIATGGAGAMLGAVSGGLGTIANAMSGATSNTNTGSIAGISEPYTLQTTFYDIPAEDNSRNGRPLCDIYTPSSLGGFMMVQKGDVEINGTFEEMALIKQFLERGFYYE